MPFQSQAQMRAAFAGGLGQEMKTKADQWAHETPNIQTLPEKVGKKKDNRVHHGGSLADLARG